MKICGTCRSVHLWQCNKYYIAAIFGKKRKLGSLLHFPSTNPNTTLHSFLQWSYSPEIKPLWVSREISPILLLLLLELIFFVFPGFKPNSSPSLPFNSNHVLSSAVPHWLPAVTAVSIKSAWYQGREMGNCMSYSFSTCNCWAWDGAQIPSWDCFVMAPMFLPCFFNAFPESWTQFKLNTGAQWWLRENVCMFANKKKNICFSNCVMDVHHSVGLWRQGCQDQRNTSCWGIWL